MVLLIVGDLADGNFRLGGFPVFLVIGCGVFGLGMLFLFFGCCILHSRQTTRIQQAVDRESAKYSMRSPIPCTWRLNVSEAWKGEYDLRRTKLIYQVSICSFLRPIDQCFCISKFIHFFYSIF
jgi:hypothetical protein